MLANGWNQTTILSKRKWGPCWLLNRETAAGFTEWSHLTRPSHLHHPIRKTWDQEKIGHHNKQPEIHKPIKWLDEVCFSNHLDNFTAFIENHWFSKSDGKLAKQLQYLDPPELQSVPTHSLRLFGGNQGDHPSLLESIANFYLKSNSIRSLPNCPRLERNEIRGFSLNPKDESRVVVK